MVSKNITIKEAVYERLKAHKRGEESFSEAVDRILSELEGDWRTNVGFLTDEETEVLESEVRNGLAEVDSSLEQLTDDSDEQLEKG